MAKVYAAIGYANLVETSPGVWEEKIEERKYPGELNRNTRRLESSGNLNDNVNVANELSIIADPFAVNNFHSMRYAELMGAKWKVTSVDASRHPRLVLSLGGLYNGQQT